MKASFCTIALALLAAVTAPAVAKSVTGKIAATVTMISGSKVSAYVSADGAHTIVSGGAAQPALTVGFELPPTWHLLKRVTWDKTTKQLTIDF